jgi:hypothetical protein
MRRNFDRWNHVLVLLYIHIYNCELNNKWDESHKYIEMHSIVQSQSHMASLNVH